MEALDRYLSLPLAIGLLAAASYAIAWNRGVALMYALFAMLVGIAAVSVIGPWWMLRRATVRLEIPREAFVGDIVRVPVAVVAHVWPSRRRFVTLQNPFPFAPYKSLFLSTSGGARETAHVLIERRGVYEVRDVRAECAYPIGLFSRSRLWNVEAEEITVFPRVHPVRSFGVVSATARLSGEVERPAPSIGQELFREVRDYRSGDNPRHIHWRSSARHSRLIVKQFDAIATSETWIVLDLDPASHGGGGVQSSFEREVEIAATIANHVIRLGLRCGVAGGLRDDGSFALWVPPRAGGTHLQAVMFALARVQADCEGDYDVTLSAMQRHYRRGQQWVLFSHEPRRASTPPFLRGAPVIWFRFDTATFETPDGGRDALQPPKRLSDGYAIAGDTDIAAVFR